MVTAALLVLAPLAMLGLTFLGAWLEQGLVAAAAADRSRA